LAYVRAAKGTGMVREYLASLDEVWAAIPPALTELKLTLVGEKYKGYILAQRDTTPEWYGENVAIFVESSIGAA
jgi:hypothetical protein